MPFYECKSTLLIPHTHQNRGHDPRPQRTGHLLPKAIFDHVGESNIYPQITPAAYGT